MLKMKLEFADGETSTAARELMPYLLTRKGNVLGDLVEHGGMDRFLLPARAGE